MAWARLRCRVKGVYSEINALLAGTADAETQAKYAEVLDQLPAMKELLLPRQPVCILVVS